MSPIKQQLSDGWLFAILTLGGLLVRLPYFHLIPLFTDETEQALHALQVWPGKQWVLSGWDNYVGPFYAYLLGGLYFLFGTQPLLPRLLSVVVGALTVGLTYLLAREVQLNKWAASVAAMLVLTSPHHVLVNSRISWSNSLLPFFTTAFLWVVLYAVYRQRPCWLLWAGVLIGLAGQLHPITVLMLPGVLLWFVWEPEAKLRSPWPYLAFVAALLVMGVVIYHNVQTGFYGVQEAQTRSYIWQQNPTTATYAANLKRLLTQLVGVAGGTIDAGKPSPIAFFYGAWLLAAWVYGWGQRPFRLLTLCFTSVLVIMPYFSNHYGPLETTRLTNHLLPLTGVMMAGLGLALLQRFTGWKRNRWSWMGVVVATAVITLYPLIPLIQYHDDKLNSSSNNRAFFQLNDLIAETAVNQPIFLSDSLRSLRLGSSGTVAYTINYLLTMNGTPHETIPAARIFERLVSQPQEARLVLHQDDLGLLGPSIPLTRIVAPANEQAERLGYGLYLLEKPEAIQTPGFILRGSLPESVQAATINLGNLLNLAGFELTSSVYHPGETLQFSIYWQALTKMDAAYTGFAHLVSMDDSGQTTLWGQDDHELGGGVYRTNVWRTDEMIVESYQVSIPPETPPGVYQIMIGVYEWPSLARLPVITASGQAQHDTAFLTAVPIEPE